MGPRTTRLVARGGRWWVAGICLLAALVGATEVTVAGVPTPAAPFPVIGKRAPDFVLTDQHGQPVQVGRFRGKLILLNFIYTHCTDVCPLTTAALVRVQDELIHRGWWATDVVFLTATTDPVRDTPAILRAYATRFKVDPRGWHFLTGDPRTVAAVHRHYGIEVRARDGGLQDHASPTFVIDRRGVVLGAYGANPNPADILHDLAQLHAQE